MALGIGPRAQVEPLSDGDDIFVVSSPADHQPGTIFDGGAGFDTIQIFPFYDGIVSFEQTTFNGIERLFDPRRGNVTLTSAQLDGLTSFDGGQINLTDGGVIDMAGATLQLWGGTLIFSDLATSLSLAGATARIRIQGGGGNDTVSGGYAQIDDGGFFQALGGSGDDLISAVSGPAFLQGESGNDTLVGGSGNDTLSGGADNDVYLNVRSGDEIAETQFGGVDRVESSINVSLAAWQFVENVTLTGSSNANVSGSAVGNVLTGNSGNNILNGNAGADTMAGGAGNDIYYVDVAGDVTTELAGGGTDLVSSSVSRTLSANIENLNLSGTLNIDGSGNTLANIINGNTGQNHLRGFEGADTLNGGTGADTLQGGTASDRLNPGSDTFEDLIRFSAAADSTGSLRDIVTGMDLNNEDRFDFPAIPTSLAFVNAGTLNLATINANLATAVDAALAANGAVLFDPTAGDLDVAGHSFLVVDANGDGVYKPNQDYVVQLVNYTGVLTLDDFI
jgi:Ca2+-binding RTX toxin-like protein